MNYTILEVALYFVSDYIGYLSVAVTKYPDTATLGRELLQSPQRIPLAGN